MVTGTAVPPLAGVIHGNCGRRSCPYGRESPGEAGGHRIAGGIRDAAAAAHHCGRVGSVIGEVGGRGHRGHMGGGVVADGGGDRTATGRRQRKRASGNRRGLHGRREGGCYRRSYRNPGRSDSRALSSDGGSAQVGEEAIDHKLVREGCHIYLAIGNCGRRKLSKKAEIVASLILVAVPQLCANVRSIVRAQDAGRRKAADVDCARGPNYPGAARGAIG